MREGITYGKQETEHLIKPIRTREWAVLCPAKPRRLNQPLAVSVEDLVPANHCYVRGHGGREGGPGVDGEHDALPQVLRDGEGETL
jgi:hypothetical protein